MQHKKKRGDSLGRQIFHRLLKNKLATAGLVIMILVILIAIFAPYIAPYHYAETDPTALKISPNWEHPLGTDNFGRDLLSRIIYGSRYTLIVGFTCATIAFFVGTIFGVLAGLNKTADILLMRIVDVMMGIPSFTLNLCLVVTLGKNISSLIWALSITQIPVFARVVRVQIMSVSNNEYIEAAVSLGASKLRIVMTHMIPNIMAPIIVQYTFQIVNTVMAGASLSFIGMGIQPPEPEWGVLINAGRTYLRSNWHLAIMPGVALIIVTYALNLLGDGLRDALDPRLKQ